MTIFVIGNSLTQDTIPLQYGADFHILPNSGLQAIYDSPNHASNLVGTTQWDTAFAATQYDQVSVQPYKTGAEPNSIATNVTVISNWVTLQPSAQFILHTAWAPFADQDADYSSTDISGGLVWSRMYYEELISQLRTANPSTSFLVNPAINVMESINQDIKRGIGPYTALSDLFRDTLHMGDQGGYYLQHNLMRRTLGASQTTANSSTFSDPIRLYLDEKIRSAVPIGIPFTPANGVSQSYGGL